MVVGGAASSDALDILSYPSLPDSTYFQVGESIQ
jgi:hypothetical protein